jgi:hypothetical protein
MDRYNPSSAEREATAFCAEHSSLGLTTEEVMRILREYQQAWQELYGELAQSAELSASDVLDLAKIEEQSLACAFRIVEGLDEPEMDPLRISTVIDAHMLWENELAIKPFRVDTRQKRKLTIDYRHPQS